MLCLTETYPLVLSHSAMGNSTRALSSGRRLFTRGAVAAALLVGGKPFGFDFEIFRVVRVGVLVSGRVPMAI